MTAPPKWSPEENEFLMRNAHREPWSLIAINLGRTELACKKQFEKIKKLRQAMGTWKGLDT
jgi:hypothetical protein